MSEQTVTQPEISPQEVATPDVPPPSSWAVSLLFWLSLTVAATLYAAVALAPKLAEWIRVRQQYAQNAARLVELEEHVDYLERVATALESDPEFARRLAQASLPDARSQQQMIPVARELLFGAGGSRRPDGQVIQPVLAEAVQHLASHRAHRRILLIVAATLVLIGFTLLNDSGSGLVLSAGQLLLAIGRLPLQRYRRNLATAGAAANPALPQDLPADSSAESSTRDDKPTDGRLH